MEERKIIIKVRAVILYKHRLLVVRHPTDTSFAALPGGHLEWGEDLRECLSREMIEELGVKPEIGRLLYINTFTKADNKQYLEFFFEVRNGADYLDIHELPRSHAHEIAEIVWVSPSDSTRILPSVFAEDFRTGRVLADEVKYIKD